MLVVAGVPLGNPQDASPRLREAMATADVVAGEDTRRLRRLARDLDVELTGRVVSHWDAVERARLPGLLDELRGGATVLLLTDAGMPLVSDPGYLLVSAATDEGLPVTVIPGPSAVTAALAVSGLPAERFCFEGFLPRKAVARRRTLLDLADEERTLVFFESPRRVLECLTAMAEAFGDTRRAAVCRELTKTHEEVVRGTLSELVRWAQGRDVLGEITLVVEGAGRPDAPEDVLPGAVAEVQQRVAAGERRSAAVADVARERGLRRRTLYEASLPHA